MEMVYLVLLSRFTLEEIGWIKNVLKVVERFSHASCRLMSASLSRFRRDLPWKNSFELYQQRASSPTCLLAAILCVSTHIPLVVRASLFDCFLLQLQKTEKESIRIKASVNKVKIGITHIKDGEIFATYFSRISFAVALSK